MLELSLGLILIAVGAVIAVQVIRNPWQGILLIAVIAPLNDLQRLPSLPQLSLVRILTALVALSFFLGGMIRNRALRFPTVVFAAFFLAVVLVVSSVVNSYRYPVNWTSIIGLILYAGLLFLIVNSVTLPKHVLQICRALVISSGAIGLLAIVQFMTGRTIFPSLLEQEVLEKGGSIVGRALGTASNPNAGSLVPLLAIPVGLALLLNTKSFVWKALLLAAVSLCGIHLVLSLSRSAWLGCAFSIIVLFALLHNRRVMRLFLVGVLVFLVVSVFVPMDVLIHRLGLSGFEVTKLNPYESNRGALYRVLPEFIGENWPLGVGSENFSTAVSRHMPMEIGPHSIPVRLFAEGGVVGLFVYLWLIFCGVWPPPRTRSPYGYLAAGLFASFLAWQVHGLFHSHLNWVVGWLVLGLLTVLRSQASWIGLSSLAPVPDDSQTSRLRLQ
jgi:hypothetical protein